MQARLWLPNAARPHVAEIFGDYSESCSEATELRVAVSDDWREVGHSNANARDTGSHAERVSSGREGPGNLVTTHISPMHQ